MENEICQHCNTLPAIALLVDRTIDGVIAYLRLCYNCHNTFVQEKYCAGKTCTVYTSTKKG